MLPHSIVDEGKSLEHEESNAGFERCFFKSALNKVLLAVVFHEWGRVFTIPSFSNVKILTTCGIYCSQL